MQNVVEKFLRYITYETTSNEKAQTSPSSPGQSELGREVVRELHQLGLADALTDSNGYVTAALPSNNGTAGPIIGFIAHLDTSPDFPAQKVKPQIIREYRGGDILLNAEKLLYLRENEFPELSRYYGQDLITTDGTTLLGADDKAGMAEIITAVEYLLDHPEIKHGPIRLAFTPDEEIGRGTDHFDVSGFGADFAYTVDGGEVGQLEMENFNAASAVFTLKGKSVHPGSAKNKMQNSLLYTADVINFFPPEETPAHTEGCQGFYHLHDVFGNVEKTVIAYIIRDHNREKFAERKARALACKDYLNKKYGAGTAELELKDSYYNMKEIIEKHPHITDLALRAMEAVGVKPLLTPIRGGTDGARLSYMGLPTPNIFTGGHNFHGPYEFIPIPSMEKAVMTIVKICELGAAKSF